MATPRFLFILSDSENLGVEYLIAALKSKKIPVDLLFLPRPFPFYNITVRFFQAKYESDKDLILRKIKSYKPDIVCFSPFTTQYVWATTQAKLIKTKYPNIFTLFGGVHVNSVPDETIKNPYIDGQIVGEADYQILEFAKHFFNKEKLLATPSVWIKSKGKIYKNDLAPLPKNLDLLPYPNKEMLYSQIQRAWVGTFYHILASRGCPFACTYCSNNAYQKLYPGQKRVRFRGPENVVGELVKAKEKFHFKVVEFEDDVLTLDEPRLKHMMKLYRRKVNLPFTCFLHPQFATEEILKILKKSNCRWLQIGVQSANENYRRTYLNRYETNADIIRVAKLCHKYKLSFTFDHIFGLPGETEADLIEAVELYTRCRPTKVIFPTLFYLPGTDIIKHGLKHKILRKSDVKRINQGLDALYYVNKMKVSPNQYHRGNKINICAFSFLFLLIPLVPTFVINWLMRRKVYRYQGRIPNLVFIVLQMIGTIKAGRLFLYYPIFQALYDNLFRRTATKVTN